MLILTRKVGEGLQIGPSIDIRILSVKDGRVQIAVDAPRDQKIVRVDDPAPWPAKQRARTPGESDSGDETRAHEPS